MKSEELIKKILEYKEYGMRDKQIAEDLGIPVEEVKRIVKELKKEGRLKGLKSVVFKPTVELKTAINRLLNKYLVEYSLERFKEVLEVYEVVYENLNEEARKFNLSLPELVKDVILFWKSYRDELLNYKLAAEYFEKLFDTLISIMDEEEWTKLILRVKTLTEAQKYEMLAFINFLYKLKK